MEEILLNISGEIAEVKTDELCDSLREISWESKTVGIVVIDQDWESYEVKDISVGTVRGEPVLVIHIIDRSGGEEQP